MSWVNRTVLGLCLATGVLSAPLVQAGVVVGGTRIIYDASKKQAVLSISNPDKDTDYLIQSWIDNSQETDTRKVPFIITPPLFRLDAEQENLLRVVHVGTEMPSDRESVYWLSVKSIAATERSDKNRLQIAVRSRMKLIYRPVGLVGEPADAYKALTFSRKGNQLSISNPTPYFVSFQTVKVGAASIQNPGMVAPKSSHQLIIPEGATGMFTWQAINDYGGISDTARQ